MKRTSVGALTLLAVLAGCHPEPAPPHDSIRFTHGDHASEGITCTRCHGNAMTQGNEGTPPVASLLPTEEICKSCHTDERESQCGFCHTEPQIAATWSREPPRVRFKHGHHVEALRGNCMTCHGAHQRDSSVSAFEPQDPDMRSCLGSCHREEMRSLQCSTCHLDLHAYSIDQIKLIRHEPGWMRRHGGTARADSGLCAQCHEPTFCEDCHQAAPGIPMEVVQPLELDRDFVHRGDFLARHPVEARLQTLTCNRCHGVTFCDECHRQSGVGGSVAPSSPHPPGWLDPLSPNGHARAARRDLLTCAACHESDAETLCVPCHRVGGVARNPHPPGFAAGVSPTSRAVCRSCHVP